MTNSTTANPYQAPASDVTQRAGRTYQPKIFTVDGRIGRLRYLAYSMLSIVIVFFAGMLGAIIGAGEESAGGIILLIAYIPVIAYMVILAKRRFNDMDKSGWFSLLNFIPLVNIFISLWLIFGRGTDGDNRYGPAPNANPLSVKIIGFFMAIVPIIGILAAVAIPAYQDYVERAQSYSAE